MVQTIAITKAITNLNDAREKFNISQTTDPQFFTEWLEELPELTDAEKLYLDRIKNRYLYYAADGFVLEGTVTIIALAPLLEQMGNSISAKKPGIVRLPTNYRPDFRLDESVDPFFR